MTDNTQELDVILFEAIEAAATYTHNVTAEEADYIQNKAKQAITDWHNKQIEGTYRKGYQAGHQKGSTVNSPRKAKAYKHELIVADFIDRLPASSKTCDCTTCKVINKLKERDDETDK